MYRRCTQPESIQHAFTSLLRTHGRIDAVVLAVGSILLTSAHRTSLDEWHTVITQNLHAAFYVVRAVTDKMQRQPDGGSILLFSTAAAQIGFANHEAIAAAKAGVEGLARATAASYAPRNIRVNVIAPGGWSIPNWHAQLPPTLRRLKRLVRCIPSAVSGWRMMSHISPKLS